MTKVSIIVRTCNRPQVLKNALDSIRNQTYKNIETVVVEDGKNVSEKMIRTQYADMNIVYRATGDGKGRTVAGNLGLQTATGEYFNFLDDDDILYPNHVETLLKAIQDNAVDAAYGIAEESQIVKQSDKPYRIKEKRKLIRYQQPYNRLLLYSFNYLPIQSVLFSRMFFDQCGGFDENLDVLEDWDLWVRYSTAGNFMLIPEITSKYYVPYRGGKKKKRGKELDAALAKVRKKFEQYELQCTAGDLQKDMDYVINVYNQKKILYYLKQVWNFFVYGDR